MGASNALQGYEKNRHFRPISPFISEMIQGRAIVTTENELETLPTLSNGAICNDVERPLTQTSRSRHYLTLHGYVRNDTSRYRHSYNGILLGSYTHALSRFRLAAAAAGRRPRGIVTVRY